jgi:predicted dehydrogenase
MKEIKIGLFGVGYFGNFHLNNLLKTRFNVVGFYDSDNQRSDLISEKFGIEKYEDPEKLIEDSDAIDITTPTTYHFSFLKKAIELKKHVFVEKPMTFNSEEAMEIQKMVENSKTILQVGHIERYNPVIENMDLYGSEIVNMEINRFSTYNPRGTDVSVVFDLMIHDIDLVLHLMGNNIKNINACGYNKFGTSLEFASASLLFENGSKATLNASIIHPYLERKMKLWTREKYYELDLGKKHKDIYSYKVNPDNNMNILAGKESQEFATTNSILDELNEFYECIANNTLPRVTVTDGYNSIRLAERILDKIKMKS